MKKTNTIKVAEYQTDDKTIYFKIPKKPCYYIDIKNPKEREIFAYSIVDTELCGLSNEGNKKTWEEAFKWAVDSKLPLIVYKKRCMLSRVMEAEEGDYKIQKVKYSTQEEVQDFAQITSGNIDKMIEEFRKDLEANGVFLTDKEFEECVDELSDCVYLACTTNDEVGKKELIQSIKKYRYEGDRIFNYYIRNEATQKSKFYQVRDRDEDNLYVRTQGGKQKYYTLKAETLDKVKQIINDGTIRRLQPIAITNEYYNHTELKPQYSYVMEFSNKTSKDDTKMPEFFRKEIIAFDLPFLKKKSKDKDVLAVINAQKEIAKLVYDDVKVKMPLKFSKVKFVDKTDAEYEFLNETNRTYWENRSNTTMINELENMVGKFIEIIGRFKLRFNQYFISLTRTDEVNDFVYFIPRKTYIDMYLKGDKDEAVLAELEESGITCKYDWIRNRYQISISNTAEFLKHKEIIFKMVKRAILM